MSVVNGLEPLYQDKDNNRYYQCPCCGDTIKVPSNLFYGRCPACLATLMDYKPKKHQETFHKSDATYRALVGGLVTENQAHLKFL